MRVAHKAESTAALDGLKAQVSQLETQCKEETTLRKRYWNALEDSKGKVQVVCRIRPPTPKELAKSRCEAVVSLDDLTLQCNVNGSLRQHVFNRVWSQFASQDEVCWNACLGLSSVRWICSFL